MRERFHPPANGAFGSNPDSFPFPPCFHSTDLFAGYFCTPPCRQPSLTFYGSALFFRRAPFCPSFPPDLPHRPLVTSCLYGGQVSPWRRPLFSDARCPRCLSPSFFAIDRANFFSASLPTFLLRYRPHCFTRSTQLLAQIREGSYFHFGFLSRLRLPFLFPDAGCLMLDFPCLPRVS